MLEVLIACLVIVGGMLGLSTLFARALGQARSALYRVTAVVLVDDLAESIRANTTAGSAYGATGGGASQACAGVGPSAPACAPAALAASDLAAWAARVRGTLPAAGAPSVEVSLAAGVTQTSHFRVQVLWREPGNDEPLTAAADLIVAPPGPAS